MSRPKNNQERRTSRVSTSILLQPPECVAKKRVSFCTRRDKEGTRKTGNQLGQEQLSSCLITSTADLRVSGGANNPSERNVGKLARTDDECQFNAPGITFLMEQDTSVSTQEVKMSPSIVMKKELKHRCDFFPKYEDPRPSKDKNTQTLYRESSAQTLPYLPEVSDLEIASTLELFSLPSKLLGDQPPGVHEVEILDRARKRWSFKDAMNNNFKVLNRKARSLAITTKYKAILEAFEWEEWIEREEYIQECQMMRLEIVIKMFDKREREMHAASKSRIENACERIEQRRQAGLRKNEIEFQRGMRRLEIQVAKSPRKWVKQTPMHALGSPCSEFYGPLLRHGVDPARRSFESKLGRKAFDMRIDGLEKRINMDNLKCPFRKLKDWSQPKQYIREYEQNFCSDANLQKLFESLRALRTQATKEKEEPKCLRKRRHPLKERASSQLLLTTLADLYETEYHSSEKAKEFKKTVVTYNSGIRPAGLTERVKEDKKVQDMENMLNIYEGSYIGWVMQFLSEEMHRLSEQRKLHFFSMLTDKERWRREAAEAGLRQKENEMRQMYEEMFQHCNVVSNEITNEYIHSILTTDMHNATEGQAAASVKDLARQIDADIERWLESFKLIQNPLTFGPLRDLLWGMVSPDMNAALQTHESVLVAQYIVEDVLFPKIWTTLEPFDISTTLTSDLISRLIDDDLYLFSSDSESEGPQKTSWREANAILRKVIRQAVPGNRWKEEPERIVTENWNDLFDEMFADIFNPPPIRPSDLVRLHQTVAQTSIRMSDDTRARNAVDSESIADLTIGRESKLIRKQLLSLLKKCKPDNVTRNLENLDVYDEGDDQMPDTGLFQSSYRFKPVKNVPQSENDVFSIKSTLDVNEEPNLKDLKGRGFRVVLPSGEVRNPPSMERRRDDRIPIDSGSDSGSDSTDLKGDTSIPTPQPTPIDSTPTDLKEMTVLEGDTAISTPKPTPIDSTPTDLKEVTVLEGDTAISTHQPTPKDSTPTDLKKITVLEGDTAISKHQPTPEEETKVDKARAVPVDFSTVKELEPIGFTTKQKEPMQVFAVEVEPQEGSEQGTDSSSDPIYERIDTSVLKSFSSNFEKKGLVVNPNTKLLKKDQPTRIISDDRMAKDDRKSESKATLNSFGSHRE